MTKGMTVAVAVFGVSRSGKDHAISEARRILYGRGIEMGHISPIGLVKGELAGRSLKDLALEEKTDIIDRVRNHIETLSMTGNVFVDEHYCFPATYGGKVSDNGYSMEKLPYRLVRETSMGRDFEVTFDESFISVYDLVVFLDTDPAVVLDRIHNSEGCKRNTDATLEDIEDWTVFERTNLERLCREGNIPFVTLSDPRTLSDRLASETCGYVHGPKGLGKPRRGSEGELLALVNGDPADMYRTASKYEYGDGVERNPRLAAMLYIRAASLGDQKARSVFRFDFDRKNHMGVSVNRFEVIEEAAKLGYADAQYSIAGRYRRGIGTEKDMDKAFHWFGKASEQGHPDAMYYLGAMYLKGRGTDPDGKEAFDLIRKAAIAGCGPAQQKMGKFYERGEFVVRDEHVAMWWHHKSANNGYRLAYYSLGEMYRDGRGVEKDGSMAKAYFTLAGNEGYVVAWFELAKMYETGCGNLPMDMRLAIHYYKEASKRRYRVADRRLAELCREKVPANRIESVGHCHSNGPDKGTAPSSGCA